MSDQCLEKSESAQVVSNYDETIESFDDMALKEELVRGIYNYGYERPSAVQQRVIAPVINGRDVILEAPFTTGKTHALCIAALQTLDANVKTCQALILTPTFSEAKKILEFTTDVGQTLQLDSPANVGRRDIEEDITALRDGQQFVVGTPRRVLELVQRDAIKLDGIRLLVLDQADEMLARDFSEHVLAIHQLLPATTQNVVLTPTMPQDVLDIATKLSRDPLHITISKCGRPLHRTKQFYMIGGENENWKLDILSHLNSIFGVARAVVFCNKRATLESLAKEFAARGLTTSAMHADMPAFERAGLMQEFRSGATDTLLATNLLARGIEASDAKLIVNYDLPEKVEDYFHRTSSGGRFKRDCVTVNLIITGERGKVRDIECFYDTEVKEIPIPN